jgi:hypothetical protein
VTKPSHSFTIRRVQTDSAREAFEYGYGSCLDNSVEGLASVYKTAADPAAIAAAIASDFPASTRTAVQDGCAAGFAEQRRRGGPVAEGLSKQARQD